MSEANRGDATMDQVAGNVKSFIGGVVGNDDMRREGEKQHAKGKVSIKWRKVKIRQKA